MKNSHLNITAVSYSGRTQKKILINFTALQRTFISFDNPFNQLLIKLEVHRRLVLLFLYLHNVDIVPLYLLSSNFPTLTVSKHCRLCAFTPFNSSPSLTLIAFLLLSLIGLWKKHLRLKTLRHVVFINL